jgi:uncharacterized protein YyaL (SSP411 family)
MPNALVRETSPYLRQHAGNPVAWLPWGEAAFAKARAEQKPIFLSSGYSTCHWCHVMAHESFENAEIARLLNEHFVAVKLDREERPDVDKVYMAYVQAMTGHGGWPLSVWLTPDLKPFYGGTYFPPSDRSGRAGFPTILQAIARGWRDERHKLVAESERVLGALRDHQAAAVAPVDGELAAAAGAAFEQGFNHYFESFDPAHSGFGGAPKFPRAANLDFLFRVAALQGVESEMGAEAVRLATSTLRAMARGGIHDHVGGGYHRYSVDEGWFVPHFEKMLYDQALITLNCLEAKQATGDERYAWMARDMLEYALRELAHTEGGFYTAEDADSPVAKGSPQHAEGAYYVWTAEELRAALGADATWVGAHFGVEENGNVPTGLDPQGELRGKNILVQKRALEESAREAGLSLEQASVRLQTALERLCSIRLHRPHPHLDDKILAANNGLMISALARSHQVLERGGLDGTVYLVAARRTAEFLQAELYDASRGELFRSWRGPRHAAAGFAEDYAYLIQGLIDLYEASFELRWLEWAVRLQEGMDARFADAERGGYFNTAADAPHIVLRLKEDYDGAEPAASSVAATNLLRLGAMLNRPDWTAAGRRCVEAFRAHWSRLPQAMPRMLCALERVLESPRHVVLAGDPGAADFRALAAALHDGLPRQRVILAVDAATRDWHTRHSPWLSGMVPQGGRATAYVCEDFTCRAPATSPDELRRLLT